MNISRSNLHPAEDGYYFLKCINDPRLFTQARSMDEAVHMARDVVETMYGEKGLLIELVIPPDVMLPMARRTASSRFRSTQPGAARKQSKGLVA